MFQTLVIGAGVAGLSAGRELLKRGERPVVIEARDRIGGRVYTARDLLSPLPLELGAEMVHGRHPALWEVLKDCRAVAVEMGGTHLRRDSRGLHSAESFEEMDALFEAMSKAPEQSFASFLASIESPPQIKQAATGFVEGFNAAFKEDVSIAWLNHENEASDETDGERAYRLVTGYDRVPEYLSHGLDVRLSTPVNRIRWKPGEVVAETDRGEFHAEKAIIAVPFSLLRNRSIEIDPEPQSLAAARDAIATGDAVRIAFRFRNAPWSKHERVSFLQGDELFPVWWTASPVQAPVITAWAAGPKALALHGLSREELIDAALLSLRSILGEEFDAPESAHLHDWCGDPFAQGAYSYVRVNGLEAQAQLRKAVEGTICFAGEAIDESGHMGTVHGAIASGIKAANLI